LSNSWTRRAWLQTGACFLAGPFLQGSATAYHPANDNHSLRIPENAEPWDSGYLVDPGDSFETTLTGPGVYDYYCAPHEAAGMVGRLIVGNPTGPGSRPLDWFRGEPAKSDWKAVPEAARATFPAIDEIKTKRVVRSPVGRT